MKLSVSNIAWEPQDFEQALGWLQALECQGVELAPNVLWPEPVETSSSERRRVRGLVRAANLEITGFHALLFTRPDLKLFETKDTFAKTIDYLTDLARVCADVEGKVMVLGSPRNRAFLGRSGEECWAWAVEGFRRTAEALEPLGVTLCIEPLTSAETEFVSSSAAGVKLVEAVGHSHFGLHLDVRALWESRENIAEVLTRQGRRLRHFHVGDPGLSPPGSTGQLDHAAAGTALARGGYDGYVSIEMRRGFGDPREVIGKSVSYVRRCYFSGVQEARP